VDGNDEPLLMGVGSIEPFKRYYDVEEDLEINTYADSQQGDGKIPAWAYVFCVGDDRVIVLQAAGIGVLADIRDGGECDMEGSDFDLADFAISGWDIDSDEAADILADHPDWPEPTEDSMQFWFLEKMPQLDPDAEEEGYPVWQVEYESEERSVSAAINANTGEVIEISESGLDGVDGGFVEVGGAQASCVEASIEDSDRSVITRVDEYTLEIELPGEGDVEATIDVVRTIGAVAYSLTGPDGGSGASGSMSALGSCGEARVSYAAGAGTYTLTITADVYADFEVEMVGTYCS
jgi:hypothetical protein